MVKKVGVLVVDDSPICQQLIVEALKKDPEILVLGTAGNGREAVDLTRSLKPNVITMDIDMPVMDGLEATEEIMAEVPTPILVLTADPRSQAPELTCRALELGALALQIKPSITAGPEAWDLAHEVKLLSSVRVIRHMRGRKSGSRPALTPQEAENTASAIGVVAIASSTGGPQVLHRLFSDLPADFPAPIVVVQHINQAFAESLAGWLASSSKLQVRLAKDGDALVPGQVLIAPPRQHLIIPARGRVLLRPGDPENDVHVPSATLMLESAAKAYGRRAVGMVLTGMGNDGAEGMLAVRSAGGRTVAQNQESCVVFGMPGAAIQKGAVERIVHGDELAASLLDIASGARPAR